MTRRGVVAAIAASVATCMGLRAQVPQSSENVGSPDFGTAWSERKPRNGQCPACGTQAKPWKRPTRTVRDGMKPGPGDGTVYLLTHEEPVGPTQNLERCAKCSAAFWQDAEGEKP
jgi:hypothetical protein